MHERIFLHKLLHSVIHKSRLKLLICMVEGLIASKKMTLSGLGRTLKRPIQERSAIRTVDRFLGNIFFQEKSSIIYKSIILLTVREKVSPHIIIDWSKIPNAQENVLRAALVGKGRAITLYEEVHPAKKLGNTAVQKRFLSRLKKLLPCDCKPIIITDAGFTIPWFKEVQKTGWDFIGRIRQLNQVTYSQDGKSFMLCQSLEKKSTPTPKSLGEIILGKSNPLPTWCYVVKKKIKGRKKHNKNGQCATDKDSKNYSRGQREGWVLVSSLAPTCSFMAKRISTLYSRRMTIEEGFRDLKSPQYGFGMEQNKTIKRERLTVWLMLAALACLVAWIVGYCAEQEGLHYQFQANSIKNRRVLSLFYLGCQVIRKKVKIAINPSTIHFSEGF